MLLPRAQARCPSSAPRLNLPLRQSRTRRIACARNSSCRPSTKTLYVWLWRHAAARAAVLWSSLPACSKCGQKTDYEAGVRFTPAGKRELTRGGLDDYWRVKLVDANGWHDTIAMFFNPKVSPKFNTDALVTGNVIGIVGLVVLDVRRLPRLCLMADERQTSSGPYVRTEGSVTTTLDAGAVVAAALGDADGSLSSQVVRIETQMRERLAM